MHDPGPVDGSERGGGADGQALQRAGPPGPFDHDVLAQRRPVDVFAHQVGPVAFEVGVEQLGRAERRHPAYGLDLPEEAAPPVGIARQARVQQLDRDRRLLRGVAQVDDSLATLTEPACQPVRPELSGIIGT